MTLDDKHLDRLFEEALRNTQREPAQCPDAELLGAYYEHALGAAEASAVEDHLAGCERCRAVVFDLGKIEAELPPLRETSFWARWMPTVGTLAAATGAVVLAIRLFPDTREARVAEEPPAARSSRMDESSRFREDGAADAPLELPEPQARAKPELRDGVGGKLAVEEKREAEKKSRAAATKPTAAPAKAAAPATAKATTAPAAKPEAQAKEQATTRDEEIDALAGARRQAPATDLNLKLAPDDALAIGEDARKGRLGATAAAPLAREERAAEEPAENERVNVAPPGARSEGAAQEVAKARPTEPARPTAASDADKADAFANLQKTRDRSAAAPAVSAPAIEAAAPVAAAPTPLPTAPAPAATVPAPPTAAPEPVGAAGGGAAMADAPQPERVASRDSKNTPAFQWRAGRDGVERSEDGGATWATVALPTKTKIVAVSSPRPPIAWAVGDRGVVLRTLDGRTWQRIASPTDEDLISIFAKSPESATITTRSGRTFETRSPTTLPAR